MTTLITGHNKDTLKDISQSYKQESELMWKKILNEIS